MLPDKFAVDRFDADQLREDRIEQRDIGAGLDRQMEVGEFGGARPPRVHHDHLDSGGILPLALLDAAENYRMAPGGIGAHEQKKVSEFDIGIACRGPVGTERRGIGRDGAGHA